LVRKRFQFASFIFDFRKWAQQDIRHINLNSKITEHKMDTVIVGDLNEPPEYVYFVVLGSCVIVRVSVDILFLEPVCILLNFAQQNLSV